MGTVTKCSTCGKLIAVAFPLHDCITNPKPNLDQIITREKFDKWLKVNRPHLASYEMTNGQKGVYRKDSSPNKTFIPYGKSWRAVLTALNRE